MALPREFGATRARIVALLLATTTSLAGSAHVSPVPVGAGRPASPAAGAGPYVREDAQYVRAGNDAIELVFQKDNGRLYGLIDKATGTDFIGSKGADVWWSLFNFWFEVNGTREYLLGAHAQRFSYQQAVTGTGATIALSWNDFQSSRPKALDIGVRVTIDIPAEGGLTSWRISFSNREPLAIKGVQFPMVNGIGQLGTSATDDYLVYPSMTGLLFQDPLHNFLLNSGWGWEQYYPSAYSTMQFMAYYNSAVGTGLYLAAEDTEGYTKYLNAGRASANWMSFGIFHVPPFDEGADFVPSYPVTVGVFSGDWYSAARIYRSRTVAQAFAAQATLQRADGAPAWYKGLSLHRWVHSHTYCTETNPYSNLAAIANETAALAGASAAMDWVGWERVAWYIDYPDVFPPKEGWPAFDAAIAATHAGGDRIWVVPNVSSFSSRLAEWDRVKPASMIKDSGAYWGAFPYGECGMSTTFVWMCPRTGYWQNTVRRLLSPLVLRNTDVIQLDGFPVVAAAPCSSPDHGHPPGGGNWYYRNYRALFERIKAEARLANPRVAFSSEGMAEPYVGVLDSMWDAFSTGWTPASVASVCVDPMKVSLIPLWQAVYHDAALLQSGLSLFRRFTGSGEPATAERPFFIRGLGRALVWGEVPSIAVDRSLNDLTEPGEQAMKQYLRRIVQARRTSGEPFLVGGRMLRPPRIASPTITLPAVSDLPYSGGQYPVSTSPAVLGSAWQAATGESAYVFTNISQESVTFDLKIDAADVELPASGTYWIGRYLNGAYQSVAAGVSLPYTTSTTLAPMDVAVLVVSPDALAGRIAGQVFADTNGNGVKDAGESGLGGWTVYIDGNDNGVLDAGEASTASTEDGTYAFSNLGAGTYRVREITPSGAAVTTDSAVVKTLAPGERVWDVDFGNTPPPPVVMALRANRILAGSDAFTVVVTGRNFANGAVVLWDGTPRTTAFATSAELRVTIAAADVASARTVPVAVRNPAPAAGQSAPATFTVTSDRPTFTDDPLLAAGTPVKAVHVVDLRSRIDALRERYGQAAYGWTDATIASGTTSVKAIHVTELRTALDDIHAAAWRSPPTYTDATLTSGTVVIRAVHIAELRAAVTAIW